MLYAVAALAFVAALRVLVCDFSIVGIPFVCYPRDFSSRGIVYYEKYVALSFGSAPAGGGLRHVENKYIRPIMLLSQMTGRIPIFPPPHMCLEARHNNNRTVDSQDTWLDYYGTEKDGVFLPFLSLPDGFEYLETGELKIDPSKHTFVHHSAKEPFHSGFFEKIDRQTDIEYDVIVFDSTSPRVWKGMDAAVRHLELRGDFATVPYPLPSATIYHELAAQMSASLYGAHPFVFIHIRRGDYFDFFDIRACTSWRSVARKIIEIGIRHVFIATNERSYGYIPSIRHLLEDHQIYGEENVVPMLPEHIRSNNYKVFLFLDSLARLSKVNVATRAHRLGDHIDCYLCKK